MTTTEDHRRTTQEAIFAAVSAGQTVYTKAPSGWMIVGPAADIVEGATVTVTKRDGSTSQVRVGPVGGIRTTRGVEYQVAGFTKIPTPAPRPAEKPRTGFDLVPNAMFGTGRRYRAQPGATQYDDGSGRYRVQIWDNS